MNEPRRKHPPRFIFEPTDEDYRLIIDRSSRTAILRNINLIASKELLDSYTIVLDKAPPKLDSFNLDSHAVCNCFCECGCDCACNICSDCSCMCWCDCDCQAPCIAPESLDHN